MIWRVRAGLLGLGLLLALGVLTVATRQAGTHAEEAPQAAPIAVSESPPPPPTATPFEQRAAQAEPTPFRETIISRVARDVPTATPFVRVGDPRVAAVDFGYDPPVLRVKVDQRVTWTNQGTEGHDALGVGDTLAWWSGPLSQGQSFSRTFATPRDVRLHLLVPPRYARTGHRRAQYDLTRV